MAQEVMGRHVVILPWGNEIEDYLDPIGLDIDAFCSRMTGNWMFGYAEALGARGLRVTILCFSRTLQERQLRRHAPTGVDILILPSSRLYRRARARLGDAYPRARPERPFFRRTAHGALRALAPYLASRPLLLIHELRALHATALLCQEYEYARFDVVVAVARLLGLRSAATFQGGQTTFSALEAWLRPHTLRACDVLFVGSTRERERLAARYALAPGKVRCVPNLVDLRDWPPIDRADARVRLGWAPGERIAICHGRIDMRAKGLDVLMAAWDRVAPRDARFRLVLVGDGVDADRLATLIEASRASRITWIREFVLDRDRIRCLLHAADLYVMASRQEGFPVAPLEAMASSLPVILSDAPGCADILEGADQEAGVIVPREDVEKLARELGDLLQDEGRTLAWGRNARAHVASRFSPGRVGAILDEGLGG